LIIYCHQESVLERGSIIVVDIGKTLSKVTLWTSEGRLLDRKVRPNERMIVDGVLRLDVDGIGAWLIEALAGFRDHPVKTIVPVGHGAGIVALAGGAPAFPPLDYEQPIPPEIRSAYAKVRDPFSVTGSPLLPDGLNIGSQLYWLGQLHPDAMAQAELVPWAQYWAWFLSGRAVSEVTSLGCHSDLWDPFEAHFSPLARKMGWATHFAPLARADDVIGTLRGEIAEATGLSGNVEILAGLHDSNAALLAARGIEEIAGKEATVLSTGTWFIAMRVPDGRVPAATLPAAQDCLVNVDAYGRLVPSARFMGGREIETLVQLDTRQVDIKPDQPALLAAVPGLLTSGSMLLPTFAPGCGPFPQGPGQWINQPDDWFAHRAAACLYAALVADVSLDLIGSREQLLVEGRFAEAEVFVRTLASLRPDTAVYIANVHNDVSFGALRLINPMLKPQGKLHQVMPLDADLVAYRTSWRERVGATA
jgi:sugar (pentulose or hexulose) kinase